MESYVPMWEKQYLIICCDSMSGLQSVEHFETKTAAEKKLKDYYEVEKKSPDNSEVHFSGNELHIVTNEWQDDVWYEITEIQVAI